MPYDDAGWHYDSVGELGLPYENAATHIGIFLAWMRAHGMSPGYTTDFDEVRFFPGLEDLDERRTTPGRYLLAHRCGEINVGDFTPDGNAFAAEAYSSYLRSYRNVPAVATYESTYAAPDTWELYDAVAPMLDEMYAAWKDQPRSE
ncbi:hypothetical protein HWD35_13215 [Tsukamurella tyrosinosolvens]|uniref:DUF7832 domain-containing protein n=1 Tax=Tsukamurella tyrosinosolvens TaxID=57704 RepID=UPI0007981A7C|nr:hypothetical protein [Tsukamurella tyrosinosolvens]KXP04469.1 hypothetical protein AXK59_13690 [Tsukamurella tyrosinosolvens]KZL97708.1 hypothetical protein AXX05_01810 [Tsukamurella tyrosinosolvens]MCA4995670.1 hypothetical protein [Tsukamurella tyrosinosolvens]